MAKAIDIPITATDKTGPGLAKANSSLKGFLSSLRQEAGRRSTIGQLGQLLVGGGALAGISFIGRQIGEAAKKAGDLVTEFRAGEKSTGELVEGLAKGLPLIGGFVEAGRQIREQFDGSARAVAELNKENEVVSRHIETQLAALKRIHDRYIEIGEAVQGIRDKTALVGQQDPAKSLLALQQQRDEIERTITDNEKKKRDEVSAKYAKQLKEDDDAYKAANAKALSLRQEANDTKSQIKGGDEIQEYLNTNAHADEDRLAAAAEGERDAAAARIKSLKDTMDKESALEQTGLRKQVVEREKLIEAERTQVLKQAAAERERIELESARRVGAERAEILDRQLRREGKDFAADLAGADQKQTAAAAALYDKTKDQLKRTSLFGGPLNVVDVLKQAAAEGANIKAGNDEDIKDIIGKRFVGPAVKAVLEPFAKIQELAKRGPAELIEDVYRAAFRRQFPGPDSPLVASGVTTATTREARFLTGAGSADRMRADQLAEAKRTNVLLTTISRQQTQTPLTFN